jgi:uncharacterized protein (TIGR02145 family)
MGVCDNSWGLNLYDLVRIPIKCASNGYYLRWWYNGWHYWFFLPGDYSKVTEGENYRTIGTRKIKMSSGQITTAQAKAIRTILNTREVYLLTVAGWMNIRLEPGTINIFDNRVGAVEIEIVAIIGSKEISYTSGYSPVALIPDAAPSTAWCEVVIGSQVWMCRNFDSNYPGSKVYNNDEANRNPYGGLYTYNQIMSPGFCPAGWHVPTSAEWATLINFIGTLADSGGKLKEVGLTHWNAPNTGASDDVGFTMVGSGYYLTSYLGLNSISNLWTADEFDAAVAFFTQVAYNSAAIAINSVNKNTFLGVRLIKDSAAPPLYVYLTTTKVGVFTLYLIGSGVITITWGDGNSNIYTLTPVRTAYTHNYVGAGSKNISIANVVFITWFEAQVQNITAVSGLDNCHFLTHIDFTFNQLTVFDTYAVWTQLNYIELQLNVLTALTTHPEWVNLVYFDASSNQILTIVAHPEWIHIEDIGMVSNLLAAFVTHPEWVDIKILNLGNNDITSLISHPEWIILERLGAAGNNITTVAEINNLLINLDTFSTVAVWVKDIDLTGGINAAPTGLGVTAKNNINAGGGLAQTN